MVILKDSDDGSTDDDNNVDDDNDDDNVDDDVDDRIGNEFMQLLMMTRQTTWSALGNNLSGWEDCISCGKDHIY